jgi:uncharacterized membrane protein YedE/YeeE
VVDGKILEVKGAGGVSPVGASDDFRKLEAEYGVGWYNAIAQDSWGSRRCVIDEYANAKSGAAGMTPAVLSLWAGFAIGLVFGAAGQVSGFCLTRGLVGYWVTGEGNKIRAFATALAVAMLGTQAADAAGLIDVRQSIYLGASFSWFLLPLGGILFGYGMVAANGCGSRAVVLLGQGNLRSFVVLVCLGIAAYMTLTGLIAPLRTSLAELTGAAIGEGPQSVPYALGAQIMFGSISRASCRRPYSPACCFGLPSATLRFARAQRIWPAA